MPLSPDAGASVSTPRCSTKAKAACGAALSRRVESRESARCAPAGTAAHLSLGCSGFPGQTRLPAAGLNKAAWPPVKGAPTPRAVTGALRTHRSGAAGASGAPFLPWARARRTGTNVRAPAQQRQLPSRRRLAARPAAQFGSHGPSARRAAAKSRGRRAWRPPR
eukprot:scaffold20328_cov116-Isochrysis_galbana.AAC.8